MIKTLLQLLSDLPLQYPGAADLYGRDTSIVLLANQGDYVPSGSFAGSGIRPPTDEEKARFNAALEIIEQLVSAPE